MPNTDTNNSSETIMGTSFLAIQTALGILRNRKLDLSHCNIEVVHKEAPKVVIFNCKNEQLGVRTETGVELSTNDVKTFTSSKNKDNVSDIIQGDNYRAIRVAKEPFERHNPDLAYYLIKVVRRSGSVIVLFTDKDRPPGILGSVSKRPEFEVELDADTLQVSRSNFLR